MAHRLCTVCRDPDRWPDGECRACNTWSCPKENECYYLIRPIKRCLGVSVTKFSWAGWLCTHCVEETLYGP